MRDGPPSFNRFLDRRSVAVCPGKIDVNEVNNTAPSHYLNDYCYLSEL